MFENLPITIAGQALLVTNSAALPVATSVPVGSLRVTANDGTLYISDGAAWNAAGSGGGGGGSVTSVSVSTANGVSGAVANPTTTPVITLTLGAITPSSVNASGTILGSNLSGTNTGDQTITLTGGVTGSGTGSFAATVASVGGSTAANVHLAELAANAATDLNTVSTIVKRDGSGNFTAGTITAALSGNATTATSSTTAGSATNFTGSLVGDVTGTQSATVVSAVGGQSSTNVAAGTVLAIGSTDLNTASAIVKRDGSGNFAAGTITAALTGTASGNPPNARAISTSAPLSGGGDLSADRTLSISQSTTSTDGYLSSTDWNTFNDKAPTASPALTGVPTAPTAGVGTSTTQIATTAFVLGQGFLGATGSMPFAHASSTSAVTSATTTYVTAISTTITTTASSAPVYAKATGTFTVTSAVPTVMKYRVSVNGVAGQEQLLSLTALATNYDAAVQYISAGLAPGTYTILFEFARNSGTGTVNFFEGTLDAIALQGTSSNGITSLSGLGLSAGPGSGAQSITGTLTLAGGGTNASLTAANGAIPYSTATALALLAPGTAGQLLRSGGAGAPTWTGSTFPASTTINQILYSSATNVISGLATANTGALVTSSTGVPSLTSGITANRLLRTNGTTISFAQANLTTDVTGTLPFAQGGTGTTAFANQRIPFSNGTTFTSDGLFAYDTTNVRLSVGGAGTAAINAIVSSGSKTALQAFNSSGGNALQATNVSAWTAALISRQNSALSGASLSFEFGRGTPAAPTGSLSGDQIGVIAALPDAADGNAYGYCAVISLLSSETATTTATGGEIVLSTTPNGNLVPVERVRVKNSGESVFSYAIRAAQYTTAAKTALTPATGWVVYDTDLNQLSYYNGTVWVNL